MTPVGLDLRGRRVLVVGAGPVGSRRALAFLSDGADVTVVAPVAGDKVRSAADRGTLTWRARTVAPNDLEGAWLVVAATDDADVNALVAAWADGARVWCVNASNAERGSAKIPAVSMHDDVTLAVLSRGAPDPQRVSTVRDALARHVDSGNVDLRRRRTGVGRVLLVGSGPGATDLLTLRAARALATADVVVTDRLGATGALDGLPPDVEVIDVGKTPGKHPVPQDEINMLLVRLAREGKTVVRLKGGDPFVFGRGGEEVIACAEAGVPCEVVPGVSSAFAVPALAGIPATHRAVADTVVVTTGHGGLRPAALDALAGGATLLVLMGVDALPGMCAAALARGIPADTAVAVVESGSTENERVTRATLATAADAAAIVGVRPPAIIVFGAVAEPGLLAASSVATEPPA